MNWQTYAMDFAGFMPPDAFWAMNDELEERVRHAAERLPLFRLEDWGGPLMLGSWQMDASEGGVVHGNAFPANPATGPLERNRLLVRGGSCRQLWNRHRCAGQP